MRSGGTGYRLRLGSSRFTDRRPSRSWSRLKKLISGNTQSDNRCHYNSSIGNRVQRTSSNDFFSSVYFSGGS
jgi:hypothetical protein